MTDYELLEFAAKAARLDVWFGGGEHHAGGYPCGMDSEGGCETWWNPLACNSDAFELQVSLGFIVGVHQGYSSCSGYSELGDELYEDHGEDPVSATRRAIVRAAAELGRNKL